MKTQLNKLAAAEVLGTKAFNEGKKRVPAHDTELIKLIEGLNVGEGASKIMEAWLKTWDLANLNTPV